MYQKYSIGTMAKLMGISSEAIRYYESRNIISPVRDPETGYRYYNTWDFHMLLRARHYQNYGFSLEEIAELFRSHELAEIRGKNGGSGRDDPTGDHPSDESFKADQTEPAGASGCKRKRREVQD